MNKVVEILMRRDGITQNEAENLVDECREEMEQAIAYGRYFEAEDILASYLGLEPDYVFDILM